MISFCLPPSGGDHPVEAAQGSGNWKPSETLRKLELTQLTCQCSWKHSFSPVSRHRLEAKNYFSPSEGQSQTASDCRARVTWKHHETHEDSKESARQRAFTQSGWGAEDGFVSQGRAWGEDSLEVDLEVLEERGTLLKFQNPVRFRILFFCDYTSSSFVICRISKKATSRCLLKDMWHFTQPSDSGFHKASLSRVPERLLLLSPLTIPLAWLICFFLNLGQTEKP